MKLPLIEILTAVKEQKNSLDLSVTTPEKLARLRADRRSVEASMKAALLSKGLVDAVIEQAQLPFGPSSFFDDEKELSEDEIVETEVVYRHHHHHYHHHWFPPRVIVPRNQNVEIPIDHSCSFAATTVDSEFVDLGIVEPVNGSGKSEKEDKSQRGIYDMPPTSHRHFHYHSHLYKNGKATPGSDYKGSRCLVFPAI
eukprot:GEMP01089344.1.p1 GENE.GEMP01089344.1~~GEMP01089344.1.p1  ORF type:complete len:197 (+),score=24.92 GEMP01089344.1:113-703(+)